MKRRYAPHNTTRRAETATQIVSMSKTVTALFYTQMAVSARRIPARMAMIA
jgi:hypothetical protein